MLIFIMLILKTGGKIVADFFLNFLVIRFETSLIKNYVFLSNNFTKLCFYASSLHTYNFKLQWVSWSRKQLETLLFQFSFEINPKKWTSRETSTQGSGKRTPSSSLTCNVFRVSMNERINRKTFTQEIIQFVRKQARTFKAIDISLKNLFVGVDLFWISCFVRCLAPNSLYLASK